MRKSTRGPPVVLASVLASLACSAGGSADPDDASETRGSESSSGDPGTETSTGPGETQGTETSTESESSGSSSSESSSSEGTGGPEPICELPAYATVMIDLEDPVSRIVSGDFDGDGFVDIAGVGDGQGGGRVVLRNDQGGGFEVSWVAMDVLPTDLAVGEFNGDGNQDLVVIGGLGGVTLYRGLGDGSFDAGTVISNDEEPVAVSVADFDEDGNDDLVVGDSFTTFRSFMGNGDGTFEPQILHTDDERVRFHALADFDEDGDLDFFTGRGSLWLGQGDGGFIDVGGFATVGMGDTAAAADVDGDGHVDGINNDRENGTVVFARGNGAGLLEDPLILDSGNQPLPVLAFDTNGDTVAEILAGNRVDLDVAIFVGNGCGLEDGPTKFPVGSGNSVAGGYPLGLAHADLDGDGLDDILSADGNDDGITLLLSGG